MPTGSLNEKKLEVCNFVCRYGDDKVFLDYFNEVALPAFYLDKKRVKKKNSFFFINQFFDYADQSDKNSLALICRIIKDTKAERFQKYDEKKGLVKDYTFIDSSPSSIAILLLKTHRLIFIKETAGAPTFKQFSSTYIFLMREIIKKFNFEILNKKITGEIIPFPTIEIIPIPSKQTISQFISRFSRLKKIKLKIAPTNNELNNIKIIELLEKEKNNVGSSNTIVEHYNKDGLKKGEVGKILEDITQGNVFVRLEGLDHSGGKIIGNNEQILVNSPIELKTEDIKEISSQAMGKFNELVKDEEISIGRNPEDINKKLEAIIEYNPTLRNPITVPSSVILEL